MCSSFSVFGVIHGHMTGSNCAQTVSSHPTWWNHNCIHCRAIRSNVASTSRLATTAKDPFAATLRWDRSSELVPSASCQQITYSCGFAARSFLLGLGVHDEIDIQATTNDHPRAKFQISLTYPAFAPSPRIGRIAGLWWRGPFGPLGIVTRSRPFGRSRDGEAVPSRSGLDHLG